MKEEVIELLGHRVFALGRVACAEQTLHWIRTGDRCRWLACINPHSHVVSLGDRFAREAFQDADWLVPDGVGFQLACRLLHRGEYLERVTGMDVFSGLLDRLNAGESARVFFLGSTNATLESIKSRMAAIYPSITIAGTYSPPFKPEFAALEIEDMIASVNDSNSDVLWVGMTAPKQEKWLHHARNRLQVRFAGAVGAVFDFFAGSRARAPQWMQSGGLEWLHRSINGPATLGRRNLSSNPRFLLAVGRELLSDRRNLRL